MTYVALCNIFHNGTIYYITAQWHTLCNILHIVTGWTGLVNMYYILQMSCNCGNQPPCVPKGTARITAGLQQPIKKGACLVFPYCGRVAAGLLQQFLQGVAQSFFSCNFAAAFLVFCSNFFKEWPSHFFSCNFAPAFLICTAAFIAAKIRSNFPAVFPSASQEISSIFWECCRNCLAGHATTTGFVNLETIYN